LNPLDENDIRLFAKHRSVVDIDNLIEEVERSNIKSLAERPFDLEGILDKWVNDGNLGSRSELLNHNIDRRINETDPDNTIRRRLEPRKSLEGATALAAAVVLCNETGIQVPDGIHARTGIKADEVLRNWDQREIKTLLERGIFNDVVYGSVRFRHREIREFLAAKWFLNLLEKNTARHKIETLYFRKQYGANMVPPRLRPILPWLILKDRAIRIKVLDEYPEIALEGGDPGCLPLADRKKILNGVLVGIVETGNKYGHNNEAIARIAQLDLSNTTLSLINKHVNHEDAIFFLARLAWQGKMENCVPSLLTIAIDPKRGTSTRMAAIRAVMSCGTDDHKSSFWNALLKNQADIPRILLADLLHNSISIDQEGVLYLLKAIEKLPAHKPYEATGLGRALHAYIDRFPITVSNATQPVVELIDGLMKFLSCPPYYERSYCRISKNFPWILNPLIHAIERLVEIRANVVMKEKYLDILVAFPAISDFIDKHYDGYRDKLQHLIPKWTELNDALFWRQVEMNRTRLEKDGNCLKNFYQVSWHGHFWSFEQNSFSHILNWIETRKLTDEQSVALSLAFKVYSDADKPNQWLDQLQKSVKRNSSLVKELDQLLNPIVTEQELERQKKLQQWKQDDKYKRSIGQQNKLKWIERLRSNPGLIRHPPGLNPGELSVNQEWLMHEIIGVGVHTSRTLGAKWESLINIFGTDVAHAYRDAAMGFWRDYTPQLPSEGADSSSVPYSIYFALAGLEIESQQNDQFPDHLEECEVNRALRYITWEINGFSGWLEAMHESKRQAVVKTAWAEIAWELDNCKPKQLSFGLLHKVTNHAPWLHQDISQQIMSWLEQKTPKNADMQSYCLYILKSGKVNANELAALARRKVETKLPDDQCSQWYALWVDTQPATGIIALSEYLSKLKAKQGELFAQLFITALMGSRHQSSTGPIIGRFRVPEHLKSLYILMHKYIRVEDDIDRANKGVYTPELRDCAQSARRLILKQLSEIPSKETYTALKELANVHSNPEYRSWMKELAYTRAEKDSDPEPWTAIQVNEFASSFTITPRTNCQLFDLAINQLIDMKNWLETDDASPYKTWKKADNELEMSNLVAGWLEQNQNVGSYIMVPREVEIANRQRIDLLMQNSNVEHPVPIELKLLDRWTGPKLEERLRNQLVGDYMREGTDRYGVMLLIWQGSKSDKKWVVNKRLTDIQSLDNALKDYWNNISGDFPKVSDIEVVVIDLTMRQTNLTHN